MDINEIISLENIRKGREERSGGRVSATPVYAVWQVEEGGQED